MFPTTGVHLGNVNNNVRQLSETGFFVTPTPKKAKTDSEASDYSRKKKSLGVLAENFIKKYHDCPPGHQIIVDAAAKELGVERRRIYDVVNILEAICLVGKEGKNTYKWLGTGSLDIVFGRLQEQAILEYPDDAEKFLGYKAGDGSVQPPKRRPTIKDNKSLAKLSQDFLQVFLVGHETLSLPEASNKIQGETSLEELIEMGSGQNRRSILDDDTPEKILDEKERKAAAARGLKTKIRRLYDIANVYLSIGLLRKVETSDASRRPNFSWNYKYEAREIFDRHQEILLQQKQARTEAAAPAPKPEEQQESGDEKASSLPSENASATSSEADLNDLPVLSEQEKMELDGGSTVPAPADI